jgi:hypothetical protein
MSVPAFRFATDPAGVSVHHLAPDENECADE